MSTARAATLLGPERLEVREYPVPEVADDAALLRIGVGGVCGTDVKYFNGRIDMPYPVILGHEIFGRIERLGAAADAERLALASRWGADQTVEVDHTELCIRAIANEIEGMYPTKAVIRP